MNLNRIQSRTVAPQLHELASTSAPEMQIISRANSKSSFRKFRSEETYAQQNIMQKLIGEYFSAAEERDFDLAIQCLSELITLDPLNESYYIFRTSAYIMVGQYQLALEDIAKIKELREIPASYVERDELLIRLLMGEDTSSSLANDPIGAMILAAYKPEQITIFPKSDSLLQVDPCNALELVKNGYFLQGCYADAIELLTQFINTDRNRSEIYEAKTYRAACNAVLGNYYAALQDSMNFDEDGVDYLRNGLIYYLQGDSQTAYKYFQHSLSLDVEAELVSKLLLNRSLIQEPTVSRVESSEIRQAEDLLRKGKYLKSIEVLQKFLETAQREADRDIAFVMMSKSYLCLGEYKKSAEIITKCSFEFVPNHILALAYLVMGDSEAEYLLRKDEWGADHISAFVQKIMGQSPYFDEADIPYLGSSEEYYFRAGEYENAILWADTFEAVFGSGNQLCRAASLAMLGRFDESLAKYDELIEKCRAGKSDHCIESLYMERGLVHYVAGNYSIALLDLSKAKELEILRCLREEDFSFPRSAYLLEWIKFEV